MNLEKPGGIGLEKPAAPIEFGRGASVGRYLTLGLLGKGGMGEVYAAYDPELDRKIALKLLRAHASAGTDPSEGRARLLREAQAIARLSDPNVVVVFDVGTFEDRVFLAMEFVDGNTLGYWLQAKPRTWREIIAVFAAAGRGLAAAHRSGVVHRDFKPDNVMIGKDGKVRVMDFGLARTIEPVPEVAAGGAPPAPVASARAGETPNQRGEGVDPVATRATDSAEGLAPRSTLSASPRAGALRTQAGVGTLVALGIPASSLMDGAVVIPAKIAASIASPPLQRGEWTNVDTSTRDLSRIAADIRSDMPAAPTNSRLTITGAMMGTPAYMAPEQFRGVEVDPRTDQFSFCVALYEGLYGQRPFAGKNIQELSANVAGGRMRPLPARTRVPGWVRKIVFRGLRVDRAERFGSMDVLLATLARDPSRAQRRWVAAAAVVVVVAGLGAGLVRAQQKQRIRCLGADAKLAGVWELPSAKGLSPRKEAIRRAFMATGKRYAADSFTVVMNAFDRYVTEWNAMHREACEATNIRGEQSADVLDLRMSCLHDRFSEVRALANIFSDANGEVVSKAVEAVQSIRPVEQCADIVALRAVVRPPDDPAVRRAVADVRTRLADVKALATAGRYKQAADGIGDVVAASKKTGYSPVVAESLLRAGELQTSGGDTIAAEKSYEEAVWLAEGSRHDEVAVEAAAQLIWEVGYRQRRYAEGERWSRYAGAVLQRLGPGHDVVAGWRENNLGMMYERQGRFEEALASCLAALTLKSKVLGGEHFDVALSQGNVALVLFRLGRTVEAIDTNNRALEILRRGVGLEHPVVASLLVSGAEYLNAAGNYTEARTLAERARAIWERETASDQPFLAYALTALGWSLVDGKQPALAIPHLERALLIRQTKDSESDLLGETRFALARALGEGKQAWPRALLLAQQARADYQTDPSLIEKQAAVDRWIGAHHAHSQAVSLR